MTGSAPSDANSAHADAVSRIQKVTMPTAPADDTVKPKVTPIDLSKAPHADSDMHVSGSDGSPVLDTSGRY